MVPELPHFEGVVGEVEVDGELLLAAQRPGTWRGNRKFLMSLSLSYVQFYH